MINVLTNYLNKEIMNLYKLALINRLILIIGGNLKIKLMSLLFLAHLKENSKSTLHSSMVPSGTTRQLTTSNPLGCDKLFDSEIIFLPDPITEI